MNLIDKLNLLRQSHYICEDCWYSCPKAKDKYGDGYCGPEDVTMCTCGADQHNAILDGIIDEVEKLMDKP